MILNLKDKNNKQIKVNDYFILDDIVNIITEDKQTNKIFVKTYELDKNNTLYFMQDDDLQDFNFDNMEVKGNLKDFKDFTDFQISLYDNKVYYKVNKTNFNQYNIEITQNTKFINIDDLTAEQVEKIIDLLTVLQFKDKTDNN